MHRDFPRGQHVPCSRGVRLSGCDAVVTGTEQQAVDGAGITPGVDATAAMEFARAALARARAHARGAGRAHWRSARGGQRLAATADADEPVFSSAGPDRRDPTSAAAILEELVLRNGWEDDRTVASITARWADIVGHDVAAHVRIESFAVVTEPAAPQTASPPATTGNSASTATPAPASTSTRTSTPTGPAAGPAAPQSTSAARKAADPVAQIVLRADSTAWATQMRLLLPALRERIAGELGQGLGLAIRVLAPAAPSWRHGNRHVAGRGPRDTYG
ncbi:MAG: DUF721 domain-containing protein [Actinobacteria bacterium]|nr:DUF721 domain-containing protein [Actinomycetota bacterium]